MPSITITSASTEWRLANDNLFAGVSFRAFLKLAACALPRPSAIASEKFAKITVNQSHRETARMKAGDASP